VISREHLLEIFKYDPDTGVFTRVKRTGSRSTALPVGWVDNTNGYPHVQINGKKYAQHRVAFLYMTGRWPANQIDHRDGDRTNNRWDNLREATNSQNSANRSVQSNNTFGRKGVYWHKGARKWTASVCLNKKSIYLGLFATESEAAAAYEAKARELFGEFAKCG